MLTIDDHMIELAEQHADESADIFSEISDAVRRVDREFDELYQRTGRTFCEFDRFLRANDPSAGAIDALWAEINGDVCGRRQAGELTPFALQRWRSALAQWQETLAAAVRRFQQSLFAETAKESLPFYTEAA